MRVQHRHIIYVQGYDPRGLAQYYRMFRTELRKFGRLYQVKTIVTRPRHAGDGEIASWSIETKADGWQTRTAYDFLRFEDFIRRDLAQPVWDTVFQAILIYWRMVFNGTIARFGKANWRFATFVTYPYLVLLAEALCGGAVAWLFAERTGRGWRPRSLQPACGDRAVRGTARHRAEIHGRRGPICSISCRDHIWTWEFAHRRGRSGTSVSTVSPPISARSSARATPRRSCWSATVRARSSATEILARALKLDPDLGRHGPRVVLLTIGANFPIVGFHAAAAGLTRSSARCLRSSRRSTGSTASRARM